MMDVVSPVPACGSSFPTTINPHDASRLNHGSYLNAGVPLALTTTITGYFLSLFSSSEGYQKRTFLIVSLSDGSSKEETSYVPSCEYFCSRDAKEENSV